MLSLTNGRRAAVIANATDMKTPDERATAVKYEIDCLSGEIDLRQYFGKSGELSKAIAGFDYIWVRGGNVFLLRRAFKQSGFDVILTELLQNDKVAHGGYSAGVCILSPSLRGYELVDPTNDVAAGYDDSVIWGGLDILSYSVAPHYKSDHPESEDVDKCVEYLATNKIPFKTLRDGEAIIIKGSSEKLVN